MVDFLKYWLAVVLLATGYAGFLLGGNWVWLGVGSLPILALLDTLIGPDYSMTKKLNPRLANIPIWICAAGPLWLYFVFAWRLSVEDLNGWQLLGSVLSCGWMGVIPLIPASHEMYHKRDVISRTVGRYAHLCILDATREIGHVVGHHIDVASVRDCDTAPRGATLYGFTPRCVIETTKLDLRLEAVALRKRGLSPWNIRHRMYRAIAAQVVMQSLLFAIAGWQGVIFGLAGMIVSRFWVESFNYFQHYGFTRVPGTPIGRRHAWNHLGWIARNVAFEVTNHCDHHMNSYLPYWELRPYKDGIAMPSVFLCFLAALVPPIWHELIIKPRLKIWDLEYATKEERVLAAAQNRAAGWPDWFSETPASQISKASTVSA